jgi:hypothetical protein
MNKNNGFMNDVKKHDYALLKNGKSTIVPENGFVPDEETAIAIAVAVWSPIYGKTKIRQQRPYHASLKNGIWTVNGSVPKPFFIPSIFVHGGTAVAEINQKDGTVIRITHYK